MKVIENIRQLYQPVQPTVSRSTVYVTYQEVVTAEELRSFIYCYWQLKTTKQLDHPFNYRVVADGCIDVFFELKNLSESFVMGFCKKYTEFPLEDSFNYMGIRFLPTMFPQIFKLNASELSNRFQMLGLVVPELSMFLKNELNESMKLLEIKEKLDDYFLQKISLQDFNLDDRLYEAIDMILKGQGVLNIETDLKTGISPRQLRRLFKFYIGDTAKTFSKVVQFQNILKAKPSTQSLRKNKLFYDVGYYDQAHFIKDFKNFYGVTPTKAFR